MTRPGPVVGAAMGPVVGLAVRSVLGAAVRPVVSLVLVSMRMKRCLPQASVPTTMPPSKVAAPVPNRSWSALARTTEPVKSWSRS